MKTFNTVMVTVVSYFFMLLFVYAAASKMMDFENFQVQLAQSPLLSAYAGFISYAVIIIEVMIAGVLADPKVRRIGLYASFGLMVAFTVYIFLILNYSDFIPCSCGGILEKMSWDEHLIFNIACVGLALTSVFMGKERAHGWRRTVVAAVLTAVLPAGIMVALFLSSEYIMKKENNFTRRFTHHPIIEEQSYDLKVNSYYFVGANANNIYLGNLSSPFRILKIDRQFKKLDTIDVVPGTSHRFQNLRYTLQQEILYAYDGSVPVIYAALINSLHTPLLEMSINDVYFDQMIPYSPFHYLMRVEDKVSKRTSLAALDLLGEPKVRINNSILTDKADGGFDADGKLLIDEPLGEIYYLFYYRNQILKLDTSLQIVDQMKTIDTISQSQIRTEILKDGSKKMSAPPIMVNKEMIAYKGLIFNKSNLMGKHESKELWKNNVVVDIYTTSPAGYWGSMYVQNRGKNKMSQMLMTDDYFYVLSGNEIIRYRCAQTLTENFINGSSRKPNPE